MRHIQRILVCVDGSPNSLRATDVASDLAKTLGAKVDLLFVVGPNEYTMLTGKEVWMGEEENFGKVELDQASRMVSEKGVEVSHDVDFGHPVEKILERAEGVDMVVMGTRGMSAKKVLSWGSVSMRVSQMAKVPVLVVP